MSMEPFGSYPPDFELATIVAITRRLPNVHGAGRVANQMRAIYRRKPRNLVDVEVLGFRMRLDPMEEVDGELLFFPQLRDVAEMEFLRRNLGSGDVFLDAGSNVGHYSLVASRLVGPDGIVMAVEPDPVSYRKLCVNLELNRMSNVRALHYGLADVACHMRLRVNITGNRGGNTFLSADEMRLIPEFGATCLSEEANTYIEDVPVLPLTQMLDEQTIGELKGVKFDIEGFEFRVLERFFADAQPSWFPLFFIVEFEPSAVAGVGGDVVRLLEGHGYKAIRTRAGTVARNYIMVR